MSICFNNLSEHKVKLKKKLATIMEQSKEKEKKMMKI